MRRIICLTALTVLLAACRQECPENRYAARGASAA